MKKFITKISAFALAAVMALPLTTSCELKKSPMETIDAAINNSMTAMIDDSATEIIQKVYEGGSAEIKVEAGPLLAAAMGSTDANFSLGASLKGYADILSGKMAFTAGVTSGGVSLADMLLYMANNSVSVSSKALFGEDVYGFSTENFVENFNNSVFGENGAYSLGLSAEQVQALLDSFTASTKAMALDTVKYTTTMNSAWEDFTDDLYPLIESHGTIETAAGTLEVGGNPYKTNDIVFTYTDEQLTALLTDVLTLFRDHESIRTMMATYLDLISSYYTEEVLAMMAEDPSTFNMDNAYTEYVAMINELLGEMDALKEEIANFNFALTVHISESSKEVIGLDFHMDEAENYANIRFVCGPSVTDIDEIGVYVTGYDADEQENHEANVAYVVTKDDADSYVAELRVMDEATVSMNSVEINLLTLTWDKKDGDYTIEITAEDQTVGFGGKYLEEEDSLTMTMNTISASGMTINFGEISLIYRANDPMPTNDTYTDILAMDAEEIQAVIMDIMTAVQEIASVFGG